MTMCQPTETLGHIVDRVAEKRNNHRTNQETKKTGYEKRMNVTKFDSTRSDEQLKCALLSFTLGGPSP